MNTAAISGTVAANCRAEAARHGKTGQDIADGTGIHRVTLSRRLNGHSPFTIDQLVAIAEFLRVPLATLLQGIDGDAITDRASA